MKKRMAAWAAAVAALACMGPLRAHHSSSMFDLLTPLWVEAAFVRFDRINPHSIIWLEETTEDGRAVQWAVEGPSLVQLDRREIELDALQAGDVVEICGFALKEAWSTPPRAETGGSPRRFVHGHVLSMPDGEKRMWGSYGSLTACLASTDDRAQWQNFLDTDPEARQVWCRHRGRALLETTAFSKAFVEEIERINGLMARPCE